MTRESKAIQRLISRAFPAKRLGAKKIQPDRGPAAETEPNRLPPKRIAAWNRPDGRLLDQWGMKGMKPVIAPTIFLKVRTTGLGLGCWAATGCCDGAAACASVGACVFAPVSGFTDSSRCGG